MTKARSSIAVDRVFDIETASWDKFVLGGIIDADGTYQSFRDEFEMFHELLRVPGTVWSWTDYDLKWLADVALRRGISAQISLSGSRISRMVMRGSKATFRDAYALILQSLKSAARMAGIDLAKDTGLPCSCGKECGGYCSISPSMPALWFKRLDHYLQLDCEASLAALQSLLGEAERCDYDLRGTVGSSAYATASRWLDLAPARWEQTRDYRRVRRAFFGGRVEVFQPAAPIAHAHDINSAYPYVLSQESIPVGEYFPLGPERAKKALAVGSPGVYTGLARVPMDSFLPPLPARLVSGRVIFPTGAIRGTWTEPELRYAIEECGVAFECDGGIVWEDAQPVLADFMARVWNCRARVTLEGNESLREWHKRFGNACYGKFAESPEKEHLVLCPDGPIKGCPGAPCLPDCEGGCHPWKCCDARCQGTCGRWRPVGAMGQLWAIPIYRIAEHAHVHWSAYCTALTRIKLHRQLMADGQGGRTAIYCDTDSCYSTERRMADFGDALGQWKYEGEKHDFVAIAPKLYRFRDPATGEVKVRAKGLADATPEGFERYARGESVHKDRGTLGIRSAAKRKDGRLFVRTDLHRSSKADGIVYGGRRIDRDGLTYPGTIWEVKRWQSEAARQARANVKPHARRPRERA